MELFCGKELCAYTWTHQPGMVAVTSANGKEAEQNVFQTYIDTRAGVSLLPYITPMVVKVCADYPEGTGLLIGLGGGAFPLLLRKACPKGKLMVVDPSADSLFIARTFVANDDGALTKYAQGRGETFIADAVDAYDYVRPAYAPHLAPLTPSARRLPGPSPSLHDVTSLRRHRRFTPWSPVPLSLPTRASQIINDAYDGMMPVSVLMEEAFVRAAHKALRSGGLYTMNSLGEWNDKVAEKAISGVFGATSKLHVAHTMNTWVWGTKNVSAVVA